MPRIIYAAMAGGGILKSINGGTSWTTIFDKESVPSIGDVAIAPSNPSIVWAGTGESNNRQSSSWGNGVYKSMDAGKTWKNMGLAETHHIARVVIHPDQPRHRLCRGDRQSLGPRARNAAFTRRLTAAKPGSRC